MISFGSRLDITRNFPVGRSQEPEPPQIWSEPESAPGPRTSGAAQKSGGSATLLAM